MKQGREADNQFEVPLSLRRESREPRKQIHVNIPLSWYKELKDLARDFDQDITVFMREATEDWLRKARKVKEQFNNDRS